MFLVAICVCAQHGGSKMSHSSFIANLERSDVRLPKEVTKVSGWCGLEILFIIVIVVSDRKCMRASRRSLWNLLCEYIVGCGHWSDKP